MLILWLGFALCALAILIGGYNITLYADIIAEKTRLGRAFIGFLFLAVITSMPELINNISAVTVVKEPDIAAGDIMGSLVFNLTVIAFADIASKGTRVFHGGYKGHYISAGFGIALISMVIVSIMLGDHVPAIGHIGVYTPLIIMVYFFGANAVYNHTKGLEQPVTRRYRDITLKKAGMLFAINSVIIIISASILPYIAAMLAEKTGLGNTFMATVFVGAATSLPEAVVTFSAVRLGAVEMALENILGSNMFDIVILAIADVFYGKGAILSNVSLNHSATGIMAIIMTAVVIMAIARPPRKKMFNAYSISLVCMWILTIYILYATRLL